MTLGDIAPAQDPLRSVIEQREAGAVLAPPTIEHAPAASGGSGHPTGVPRWELTPAPEKARGGGTPPPRAASLGASALGGGALVAAGSLPEGDSMGHTRAITGVPRSASAAPTGVGQGEGGALGGTGGWEDAEMGDQVEGIRSERSVQPCILQPEP